MRSLAILVCLSSLAGCSAHPTDAERALLTRVEKEVVLPEGGGELQCYERHYLLLKGEEADKFAGFRVPGGSLLVAKYLHGRNAKPGIYWAKNDNELPKIYDAGCSVLEFWYAPGAPHERAQASCSPDIAGHSPDTINPPVTC